MGYSVTRRPPRNHGLGQVRLANPTAAEAIARADGVDALLASSTSLPSGLRPMAADRLHALFLDGVLLSPAELAIAAWYRQTHPARAEVSPVRRRDGQTQTLPVVAARPAGYREAG